MNIKDVSQYWDRVIHKNSNIGQTRRCPVLCTYYYFILKTWTFQLRKRKYIQRTISSVPGITQIPATLIKRLRSRIFQVVFSSCIKSLNCVIHNNNNIKQQYITTIVVKLRDTTYFVNVQLYMLWLQVLEYPNKRERESIRKSNSRKD